MTDSAPAPAHADTMMRNGAGGIKAPVTGASRPSDRRPSLRRERALWRTGHRLVAGVDEVGRGAWAGPLTVGVVVVGEPLASIPSGLRDSKLLSEARREELFDPVRRWCAAWAVGHVQPAECDALGMSAALRLAAWRAFAALPSDQLPDAVVLDGTFDYVSPPSHSTLFGGHPAVGGHPVLWAPPVVQTLVAADAVCASVSAASVLAKVSRDRLMRADAECYPGFDFERNKGYPSPAHQRALRGYGLTAIHRRSWAFTVSLPWAGGTHPRHDRSAPARTTPAPG